MRIPEKWQRSQRNGRVSQPVVCLWCTLFVLGIYSNNQLMNLSGSLFTFLCLQPKVGMLAHADRPTALATCARAGDESWIVPVEHHSTINPRCIQLITMTRVPVCLRSASGLGLVSGFAAPPHYQQLFTDILVGTHTYSCLLYTSPSPRDGLLSRMPSSA